MFEYNIDLIHVRLVGLLGIEYLKRNRDFYQKSVPKYVLAHLKHKYTTTPYWCWCSYTHF